MTLANIRAGGDFVVTKVLLNGEVGKRLADMGFIQGSIGKLVRTALMGDPIHVRILGYNLSIRKSEAAGILVDALVDSVPAHTQTTKTIDAKDIT